MFRFIRFLIITLTLGRIKWLMRLNWLWRFIVFLGITSWFAKKLRQLIGLEKKASTDVDSAWADALRYTPQPATATATAGATSATAPPPPASQPIVASAPTPSSAPVEDISESTSEVTGMTADGSVETITIHEVSVEGDTESIVRIEDEAGHVETLVTGTPVEDLDLANLGEPAAEGGEPLTDEPVAGEIEVDIIEIDDTVIAEPDIEAEAEIVELIETLEAAEPEIAEPAPERKPSRRKRAAAESAAVTEPLETTDEDPDPYLGIEPDWVRGDGGQDCPESHPVKAKASSMIYYTPESGHYERTVPDVCFATAVDAEAAGYRAPRR